MDLGISLHQLGLFVVAGLLLNLTPGPDVLYIVTAALRHGRRAGVWAALGITAGCGVHIVAATVGVSALVVASQTAFTLLKWLGAAYLVWTGLRLLLARSTGTINIAAQDAQTTPAAGPIDVRVARQVFTGAFWTNALNPKVAVFFLAFLPQFIDPASPQPALAFLLLGLLFDFNGLWVNIAWALLAAWAAQRASVVRRGLGWLDKAAGVMFVGFGIRLATSSDGLAPVVGAVPTPIGPDRAVPFTLRG